MHGIASIREQRMSDVARPVFGTRERRATIALVVLLAAMMAFAVCVVRPDAAWALKVRPTDVQRASQGCYLLGVEGEFTSAGKDAALKRINEIRKEACEQGVPDPRDPSKRLASSDYASIKWSSDLEKIAQTRAAEGAINQDHSRPNGGTCFDAYADNDVRSYAECLAWNYSGMLDGIDQWYEEKQDWVKQNDTAVTGHYTALIDPSNTHVGLGTFAPASGGWACTAGEFFDESYAYGDTEIPEDEVGVTGPFTQAVEIPVSAVTGCSIVGKSRFAGSASGKYRFVVNASLLSAYGTAMGVELVPLEAPTWSSGAKSVVEIDQFGKAKTRSCGKAKISAAAQGLKATTTVTVVPKATKIKKLSAKKKALSVAWAKAGSSTFAQGYQVRYSAKSSMKGARTVTVKGAKKASRVIKKLAAKKKYYVQVRTYAKSGGTTYYSAWSSKKAKKTS